MDIEQELNRRRAAPTKFWIELALLIIASLLILLWVMNSRKKSQTDVEKRISYSSGRSTHVKNYLYGKEKI